MLVGLVLAICAWAMPAAAHIALWDESMFGWDPNDPNQSEPVLPLMHLNFNEWWFHGYIDKPPASGKFMTLPAGGTYHGQVACNKALTSYGQNDYQQTGIYACDGGDTANGGIGAMHTKDKWDSPNPTDVKGCGISIAYVSDEHAVQPEDFTVISTNYTCPWFKHVDFQIPSDLPACPPEGCLCSWGWVHSINGGAQQNYHLVYRCKVEGATGITPIPKAKTANMCNMPDDISNCTVGAKQPHYWYQNERNNNPQGEYNPPFYNAEYGFINGAQTDLFATVGGSQKGDSPSPSPISPSPIPSSAAQAPSPAVLSSASPPASSHAASAPQPTASKPPATSPSSNASIPATTTAQGTQAGTCRRRKRALERLATMPDVLQKHKVRSVKRAAIAHGRQKAARGDHFAELAKQARAWEERAITTSKDDQYSFAQELPQYPCLNPLDIDGNGNATDDPSKISRTGAFASNEVGRRPHGASFLTKIYDGENDDYTEMGQTIPLLPADLPCLTVHCDRESGGDCYRLGSSLVARLSHLVGREPIEAFKGPRMIEPPAEAETTAQELADAVSERMCALGGKTVIHCNTSAVVPSRLSDEAFALVSGVTMSCAFSPVDSGVIPGWNYSAAILSFERLAERCHNSKIPLVLTRLETLNVPFNHQGQVDGFDESLSSSLHPDDAEHQWHVMQKVMRESLRAGARTLSYLSGKTSTEKAAHLSALIARARKEVFGPAGMPDDADSEVRLARLTKDLGEDKWHKSPAFPARALLSPHLMALSVNNPCTDLLGDMVTSTWGGQHPSPGIEYVPVTFTLTAEGGISIRPSQDPNSVVYLAVARRGYENSFLASLSRPSDWLTGLAEQAEKQGTELVQVVDKTRAQEWEVFSRILKPVLTACSGLMTWDEGMSLSSGQMVNVREHLKKAIGSLEDGAMARVVRERLSES